MNSQKDINNVIEPFFWVEHSNSFSVCLNVGYYKQELFEKREEEGFDGNGYDWASLAKVFLEEQKPEFIDVIKFDPEGSMFCAYSSNKEALQDFIIAFKNACENKTFIEDLFSRAILD
ncbi:immunity 51 family protein [Flavobacterium amniphilum]|uniref:immunity 51 family protein n=1 Tax=Flavobacterium amniphilum TaxID=1834035 RepID=UPI00202A4F12|nr:immunity 51 family protein [Flavobacterium amniphilum]MCL9807532.1 immunity 51 family protein [Flavobacterium amniphilum]